MKKVIYYQKTAWEPLTDVVIARCPDVYSFHFSLDRIFGDQYEFSGETHPFYELVYVLSGTVGITEEERVYSLNAGQYLVHAPNAFHRIWSEKGTEPHVLNLSFHAGEMPDLSGKIFSPDVRFQEEFLEISMEVRDCLHRSDMDRLNEQRLRFERWLLATTRTPEESGRSESSGALRYAEIVSMMQKHLGEQLTSADIAHLCRMSLSNLKKTFTKYAGMGVSRYFTEMKMRRATELLRSGKRVGEVAAELGYSDQNYFSTVFRRIMGDPPGKYRS